VELRCPAERAERLVVRQARGRLGLTRERVDWIRPAWVAYHLVVVATTVERRPFLRRNANRSSWRWNLYDSVTGTWWRSLDGPAVVVPVPLAAQVPPALPAGRVTTAIRRAVARREACAGAPARDRWAAALEELGVPGEASSVSVERTETLYWPFWIGLVRCRSETRLVAVDGVAGAVCPAASQAFTAGLAHVLRALDGPPGCRAGRSRW
jgi:hypothetical protein